MEDLTTTVETEDVEVAETAPEVETPAEDGEAPEPQSTEQAEGKPAKDWHKEFQRTTQALANLQKENARLKAERESKDVDVSAKLKHSIPDGLPKEVAEHPALKGLTVDVNEDGEPFAKVGSRWVHVEDVIDRYEDKQTLTQLKELVQGEREAKAEAEQNAQIQKAWEAVAATVQGNVTEMREQAFPNLPKEYAPLVDKYVLQQADVIIGQIPVEQLTGEVIENAAKQAFEEAKLLFGIYGSKQLEHNQQKPQQIKPGGAAGVPGAKSLFGLSTDDWNEAKKRWPG